MNPDYASKLSTEFLVAANRASETKVVNDLFQVAMVPGIVCAAFSIEIGLKAVVHRETGRKASSTHKLDALFEEVSSDTQNKVANMLGMNLLALKEKLIGIGNAFVEWRYVYESDSVAIDHTFLFGVANAVSNLSREA